MPRKNLPNVLTNRDDLERQLTNRGLLTPLPNDPNLTGQTGTDQFVAQDIQFPPQGEQFDPNQSPFQAGVPGEQQGLIPTDPGETVAQQIMRLRAADRAFDTAQMSTDELLIEELIDRGVNPDLLNALRVNLATTSSTRQPDGSFRFTGDPLLEELLPQIKLQQIDQGNAMDNAIGLPQPTTLEEVDNLPSDEAQAFAGRLGEMMDRIGNMDALDDVNRGGVMQELLGTGTGTVGGAAPLNAVSADPALGQMGISGMAEIIRALQGTVNVTPDLSVGPQPVPAPAPIRQVDFADLLPVDVLEQI